MKTRITRKTKVCELWAEIRPNGYVNVWPEEWTPLNVTRGKRTRLVRVRVKVVDNRQTRALVAKYKKLGCKV